MLEIAEKAVRLAMELGATGAECTLQEGDEFTASVRVGELETLKEAGSRGAGLRILLSQRVGSSYTSDLTAEGIEYLVKSALEIASISTEDPYAGLPDPERLGSYEGDLKLSSDDAGALDTQAKIDLALAAEAAALSFDPRIANSEGGSFGSSVGAHYFANSLGFKGCYKSTSCSLSVVPVAKQGESMERDYWYSVARGPAGLESAAHVGRLAAERAIRRLGARKIATCRAPVMFEPRVARRILGDIFEAIEGDSVYRRASFLAEMLGQRVASENVTIIDDGTMTGLFGSSPFDDEGVPTRRTVVVERGVLRAFLLNSYTGRKLGMPTTGNASRGITGNAGVGHHNFYLEPGTQSAAEILRGMSKGLLVTELIGHGGNTVTGDYSSGAVGLWVEGGEVAYPVSEITIAANLKDMLLGVHSLGNDLEFRGSVASPTLVFEEMTISGQ